MSPPTTTERPPVSTTTTCEPRVCPGAGTSRCWCTKFHPDCAEKGQSAEGNRALKQRLVADGIAHAALVYDGDRAVAWAEYGSPEELPSIHHRKELRRHCRATARLPGHLHPGRARPSRSGPGGDRPARSRRADRAGRRRPGRELPARHRRGPEEELVVPLQRHPHDVRARGLHLRPAQGPGQLRDGARGGPEHARLNRSSAPRGDDGSPAPRRLYESLGFSTMARTCTLSWDLMAGFRD